jgi:hypothetical protein
MKVESIGQAIETLVCRTMCVTAAIGKLGVMIKAR